MLRESAEESKKVFFKKVSSFLPRWDPRYKQIEKAYDCAEVAMKGKFRESGERAFLHSRAAALTAIIYAKVRDPYSIIEILLHDIVEDCREWTIDRIRKEFGGHVAMFVGYSTKPPRWKFVSKEFRDRVYRLKFRYAPREFFEVKLLENLHNIMTLDACSPRKRQRQIEETRRYYLPYAKKYYFLYKEFKEALERAERLRK